MQISINVRTIFYAVVIGLAGWFLYKQFDILTPFVIALIFAYVFNPLINFFQDRLKLPRTLSIIFVYLILIASVVGITLLLTDLLVHESVNIVHNFNKFLLGLKTDTKNLPGWLQPVVMNYLDYFNKDALFSNIHIETFPLVSHAFNRFINLFAFLFAAFFFLKDYKKMIDKLVSFAPRQYHDDINLLLRRINRALASYLRGQLIVIVSMAVMLFVVFTLLGVKNAFTISIVSALCEIVPFIGPVVAAVFGIVTVIISGGIPAFVFEPMMTILVVLAIYYVSRQIQDYLIIPFVYGRATDLHPLVILFSVLAGEHIYGILGVLLAVPVAASLKIMYEYFFDKLNEKESSRKA